MDAFLFIKRCLTLTMIKKYVTFLLLTAAIFSCNNADQKKTAVTDIDVATAFVRDNTDMLGEKHFRSLFKNSDIPIIRQLHKQGKSNKEIDNIYNSHHSTISKIIRGHTWTHI